MTQPSTSSTPSRRDNDVFVSYSRKDKAFVQKLDAAFRQAGRDPWVDWDDIRKGEDWWQSIQRGIEEADTFVFVISPDSVASEVCRDEVDYATQLNKRFMPLLHREGFEMADVHPSIARHNWLFFRSSDDFNQAFKDLLLALDTDLDYVRTHTRLLVRSLEWQNQDKDPSYLLRGKDLSDAQHWCNQGINRSPRPTDSQAAYIEASQAAQRVALKARQKAKWVVVLTAVIANLAFVAGGLHLISERMLSLAEDQLMRDIQDTLRGAAYGIDGDEFEDLVQAELPANQNLPTDNVLYQRHQTWLEAVHEVAPLALPRTYAKAPNSSKIEIIGDIYRIIKPEKAYGFRAPLPQPYPELLAGFEQSTIDLEDPDALIHLSDFHEYTEDGENWFFVFYTPIRNSSGEAVGVLELAYEPEKVDELQDTVDDSMDIAGVTAIIWFVVSSVLILRATRPSHDA